MSTEAKEKVTLMEHIIELRSRLIFSVSFFFVAFVGSYIFAQEIYSFLVAPLAEALDGEQRRMIFTGLTEAFFTYIKLAFFAGFIASFPVLAAQLYLFLAPGLYKHEKSFFVPFIFIAPILFLLGAGFVYYFIMPLAWEFFLSFETLGQGEVLPIQMEARISEYLALVMHLILGFGLAFQLPVILLMLAKFGFVTPEMLQKKRRIAFVIIIIAGAVLTPPDIISQLGLAVMLYALYEISIIGVKLMRKS